MGICGWINTSACSFGNRDLMVGHNIEGIPTRTKGNRIHGRAARKRFTFPFSGNLAAMFIVEIQANQTVRY